MCLSAGGVVALPGWGWPFFDPSLSESHLAQLADVAEADHAITRDPGTQNSPSIAANPRDSAHLVLAYMDYTLRDSGYASIAVQVSRDAGRAWQESFLPLPAGFEQGASDPIAGFDGDGHVFVSFMAAAFEGVDRPPILNPGAGNPRAAGFEANNGIFVARSDDGGVSWRLPVPVAANRYHGTTRVPFEIFPDMAIDHARTLPDGRLNPHYGNIYVTWARYYPAGLFPGEPRATGGSDVMMAVSGDLGQTWQLRTRPPTGTGVAESVLRTSFNTGSDQPPGRGYLTWPRVSVGALGDVSVADYAGAWFLVNHSVDAGTSFFVPSQDSFLGLPFGSGAKLLTAGLSNNSFRTVPTRAIAADPARPGHVYVAEPLPVFDKFGSPADAADIFFARSEDFGRSWESAVLPRGDVARVVNDDNGGRKSDGSSHNVAADQFMVRMQVNARGDIGLVWYDTRRDPANHLLDVFGTISSDGGRTFSPNFRVTDQSFDADLGAFTDATGRPLLHLGDGIGLAMTETAAYVAWTDTRLGNQDVFFRNVPLHPLLPPLNDRFEPNDVPTIPTDLGPVVTRTLPGLALEAGDVDWFRLQSLATGTLRVTIQTADSAEEIKLRILDASGHPLSGESVLLRDSSGGLVGRQVVVPARAGQSFAIQVLADEAVVNAGYALEVNALTENLGPLVLRQIRGVLGKDDQAFYLFESTAAGTVTVGMKPLNGAVGKAHLAILDPRDLSTLVEATGNRPQVNLAVKPGQELLLGVAAAGTGAERFIGQFALQLENIDQYSSPEQRVLHFPSGVGPSQLAVGDFNRDQVVDVAVTNAGVNTISVSMGNGDGTFSAPRSFGVGAFQTPNPVADDANLFTYRRDILTADFNGDGLLDLVVTNYDSADVSLLLGRGDGTFQPQRRFDAAAFPIGLASGDVDGDGYLDLVVIDSPEINIPNKLAVLLGRGDGTFSPQKIQELPHILFLATVALGDFDRDGVLDLVAGGGITDGVDVFRGVGDGRFLFTKRFAGSRQAADLALADLNGDGNLDIVAPSLSDNNAVTLIPGTGNLTFGTPQVYTDVGQGPLAVRVADWGSQVTLPDGSQVVGPPDGHADLIVVNSGVIPGPFAAIGAPNVVLLAGLADERGAPAGFGDPIPLAAAEQPLDLEIADTDGDGSLDILVVDRDGFFVIYGQPPTLRSNLTREMARDLGILVHSVQPTLTILPGQPEAWFRMQVVSEAVAGGRDQVLDFSAGFAHVTGAGLQLEVIDSHGSSRGAGDRLRLVARQGETLFVRVFSLRDALGDPGAGAYTLVINTLPQLVATEAPTLLPGRGDAPGGPTSSLVLVFQGDRLDPTSAQDPGNYRVTWLGPDGVRGTNDDRVFIVGAGMNFKRPVIYNPSGNRDVQSGRTYPNAVRQTVTLLFADALPAGSYQIDLSPQVQAAPFNADERSLLTPRHGFTGHPVVFLAGERILEGSRQTLPRLVRAPGTLGDLTEFEKGTRFLTQLHADLGALLDSILSETGDDIRRNTEELIGQLVARLVPALGPVDDRLVSLLVILLDPVSISLLDPAGKSFKYDLQKNTVANNLSRGFVEVGGNVELVVLAQPQGTFELKVADVPPLARGGVVYLGRGQVTTRVLTTALRAGERSFRLAFADQNPIAATLFNSARQVSTTAASRSIVIAQTQSAVQPDVARTNLRGEPFRAPSASVQQPLPKARFARLLSEGGWKRIQDERDRFRELWRRLVRKRVSWMQAARSLLKATVPFVPQGTFLENPPEASPGKGAATGSGGVVPTSRPQNLVRPGHAAERPPGEALEAAAQQRENGTRPTAGARLGQGEAIEPERRRSEQEFQPGMLQSTSAANGIVHGTIAR